MYMYYISQDLCLIMYCIIQDSRVNHAATTMSPTPYPLPSAKAKDQQLGSYSYLQGDGEAV